jgi:hypothetical protein
MPAFVLVSTEVFDDALAETIHNGVVRIIKTATTLARFTQSVYHSSPNDGARKNPSEIQHERSRLHVHRQLT